MNNIRKQSGFTLIELMIVIAILAILLAIAVPAYQNYTIRANVSECISIAASTKLAVVETAQSNGVLANDSSIDAQAVWGGNAPGATTNCGTQTLANGTITVPVLAATGTSGDLAFAPTQANSQDPVQWTCTTTISNPQHVPAECRGT